MLAAVQGLAAGLLAGPLLDVAAPGGRGGVAAVTRGGNVLKDNESSLTRSSPDSNI